MGTLGFRLSAGQAVQTLGDVLEDIQSIASAVKASGTPGERFTDFIWAPDDLRVCCRELQAAATLDFGTRDLVPFTLAQVRAGVVTYRDGSE